MNYDSVFFVIYKDYDDYIFKVYVPRARAANEWFLKFKVLWWSVFGIIRFIWVIMKRGSGKSWQKW